MDAIDKLLLLCIAVSIIIWLIADTVVLSVSPIKTSWKKGEVMEIYEKGRLKKYLIASKFLKWSSILIGGLVGTIFGRIVFAQLSKKIWAVFRFEGSMGTVMMISIVGILISILCIAVYLFKIYASTDFETDFDLENKRILTPINQPNTKFDKSFRKVVISWLFFVLFFVLFIVARNLGI